MKAPKNDRKRKERPLTSYFSAAPPFSSTTAATAASARPLVATKTANEAGSATVELVKESSATSIPVVPCTQQQSAKRRLGAAKGKGDETVTVSASAAQEGVKRKGSCNDDTTDRDSTQDSAIEATSEALTDATNVDLNKDVKTEKPETKEGIKPVVDEKDDAPAKSSNISGSLLHQLLGRSMYGKRVNVSTLPTTAWKIPSWIDLHQQGNSRNVGIKSLAWDDMGVLLAAYCEDRYIRIYDWDMVLAADRQGRNRRARLQTMQQKDAESKLKDTGCFCIEPILTFSFTAGLVSSLKWNPFNPDELAVGTLSGSGVHLYDVGQVSAQQQLYPRLAAPFRKVDALSSGHVSDFVFVDGGDRMILSCDDVLCCWSIVGETPSLIWKYRWKPLSSMVSLCKDVLVLGSKHGHLALLNWKKTQRNAFSLKASPTILDEWISYRGLDVPSSSAMGIQHLRIETLVDCQADSDNWGHCRLSWVTACGWALSTTLCSTTKRTGRSKINYATKPIQCLNFNREIVKESKRSWSYNGGVVVSDGTKSVFCWSKAAEVTKVLPHHNKYVLDSQARFEVQTDSKPTLLWKGTFDDRLFSIPLSKRKGPPTAIAVHPSHEWVIVGTRSNGLYAVNSRCKI